jgi:hypothetical protein
MPVMLWQPGHVIGGPSYREVEALVSNLAARGSRALRDLAEALGQLALSPHGQASTDALEALRRAVHHHTPEEN